MGVLTKRLAIQHACRKLAGPRVPADGESWDEVDCFSLELFAEDQNRYLLQNYSNGAFDVLLWNGSRFKEVATLDSATVSELSFEARRFYRGHMFLYRSPAELLIAEWTGRPWRHRLADSWAQGFYNRRTPMRRNLIDVLKQLIELRLSKAEATSGILEHQTNGVSHIEIAEMLYGIRLFGHPKCDRQLAEVAIALEALAATGDAIEVEHGYAASANAYNTITVFELDERRHDDSIRWSIILSLLTFGLVIVGSLQFIGALINK